MPCRSDYFETLEECALLPGCLPVGLGAGCVVQKCIIDKNARIGANVKIVNKDGIQVPFLTLPIWLPLLVSSGSLAQPPVALLFRVFVGLKILHLFQKAHM